MMNPSKEVLKGSRIRNLKKAGCKIGKPIPPKCLLSELTGDTRKVANAIIKGLVTAHYQDPDYRRGEKVLFDGKRLGLEATLEVVEGLINTGHIRIIGENECYHFGVWDGEKYI